MSEYNNNLTVKYDDDIQIYNLSRLVNLTIDMPQDYRASCFSVNYTLYENDSCKTVIKSTEYVEI